MTHWERGTQVEATLEEIGAPGVAPLALSEAGSWLCSRHPMLRELVERIGAWQDDAPVLWKVRDALNGYDDEPGVEYATSLVLMTMAPGEIGRLRLLATLAPRSGRSQNARFCMEDLGTFDTVDRDLIEDWLRCVRIGVLG